MSRPRQNWTTEDRNNALALYKTSGPAQAERDTGIPRGTIASWAARYGVQTDAPSNTRAAIEAAAAKHAVRRSELNELLLNEAVATMHRMGDVYQEWIGTAAGVREVEYAQPPAGAVRAMAQTVETLIKTLRLEQGEVTSRSEVTTRDALTRELDELAAQLSARADPPSEVVGDRPTEAGNTAG